jgi:hypothetical protein
MATFVINPLRLKPRGYMFKKHRIILKSAIKHSKKLNKFTPLFVILTD